jgi:ParB family chromosome partitioning protein
MASLFVRYQQVNKVLLVPVDSISPNPMQPRRSFDPQSIAELAQSIRENGLLQPVTVRLTEKGGFELIAGERRLTACKSLGMQTIPAIVEEVTEEQSAALALVEILQREDLHFFEEAAGIEAVIRIWNIPQQQAAHKLGMAQSTLANKLRLLRLPEAVRSRVEEAGLTERHARLLLRLEKHPQLEKTLESIIERSLNVEESERLVESLLKPKGKPTRLLVIKDLRIFINTLNRSVDIMRQAGIHVDAQKQEDENFIRFLITVPKSAVTRSRTTA